ncbi:carboxymuconolactone decarboxylase family protein [Ornithinibacillus halophilus]|uniref:Alkylhydroperoxidase AhpD family core domain-containing protein n=1 Tax=Ornithinibacillus halophilus TaxID=930117 RepID=A0A1M5KXW7_9BACI|nr:carboxymuconolactone decarboxylase family protein [Ornithinibacillus halophilus]SHG57587.1 alkylhydroperoxidase AhpD family core domain-containing protein [Ornithinibacillus halophilus]
MEHNAEELDNYFDQSILDYKEGSSQLEKYLPETVKGYYKFTEGSFEPGAVSQKHKQLMALGISIYAQDEYCIIYHAKGAVEQGANEEELMETIAVSAALGGGAAYSQGVTLAMDAFYFYQDKKSNK